MARKRWLGSWRFAVVSWILILVGILTYRFIGNREEVNENPTMERKEHYVLNPDGTGKVTITQRGQVKDLFLTSEKDKALLREMTGRTFVGYSKGVNAWKDFDVQVNDDHTYLVQGTAYFEKFSDVSFGNISFTWSQEMAMRKPDSDSPEFSYARVSSTVEDLTVTAADIAATKEDYTELYSGLDWMFNGYRLKQTLALPGDVKSFSGFKKGDDPSQVTLNVTGEQLLACYRTVFEMGLYQAAVRQEKSELEDQIFRKALYGEEPRVNFKGPLRMQFDYESEQKDVMKSWARRRLDFGIAPPNTSLHATKGEAWGEKDVTMTLAMLEPRNNHLGEEKLWARFELAFPQNVVLIRDPEVGPIVDAHGKSLLKKEATTTRGSFGRVLPDNRGVEFTIMVPVPSEMKHLSSLTLDTKMNVFSAQGSRTFDMGMMEMKRNAAGNDLGLIIDSVKRSKKLTEVELRLGCPTEYIKNIRFVDENNKDIPRDQSLMSGDGSPSIRIHQFKRLPRKARILVDTYDTIHEHSVSFSKTIMNTLK